MADAEYRPMSFLNNKFISCISFNDQMIEKRDPKQSTRTLNPATCISRQQIVNHLKSDKFEFRTAQDTKNVNHENTYVSISDSIYQSLDKTDVKKFPCPVLVCNLLASHADTFRFYQIHTFKGSISTNKIIKISDMEPLQSVKIVLTLQRACIVHFPYLTRVFSKTSTQKEDLWLVKHFHTYMILFDS